MGGGVDFHPIVVPSGRFLGSPRTVSNIRPDASRESAHTQAFTLPADLAEKKELTNQINGANFLSGSLILPTPPAVLLGPDKISLIFAEKTSLLSTESLIMGKAGTPSHVFLCFNCAPFVLYEGWR